MRRIHIGAALIAGIVLASSCGENQSPVAPTPTPEPTQPVQQARSLKIVGTPESPLPAGEGVVLTAQISHPDGRTEETSDALWWSTEPLIATVERYEGIVLGLRVGQTSISATLGELTTEVTIEVTNARPNETLWREIAFNYFDCPETDANCRPLAERTLQRLPVTSPNFQIVSHTLNEEIIANLYEMLPQGAEQITGDPYRGTIQEGDGVNAANWITIEGVVGQKRGTVGPCMHSFIPEGGSASAIVGGTHGCILLGTDRENPESKTRILHELGHAMGFWHSSSYQTIMFETPSPHQGENFTDQEQYHTQFAYRQPRGATYAEIQISTFGPRRHVRPRPIDPRPIFIVD